MPRDKAGHQTNEGVVLTPKPLKQPTLQPIQSTMARLSPEQAVRDYYTLIEKHQCIVAWNRLTGHFKETKNRDGYNKYEDWYRDLKEIEISNVNLIQQTETSATLVVDITYIPYSGPPDPDSDFQIFLVWDSTTRQWMFDETK